MAYGVNAANGLVPKGYALGTLPSSGLASQRLFTFNIQNGYANNIGVGDLVFFGAATQGALAGYILAAPDAVGAVNTPGSSTVNGATTVARCSAVGVFAGCQYNSSNVNDLVPSESMKLSWRASTVTADGNDPIAFIIPATYEAGFSIQTDINACTRAGLLKIGTYTVPTLLATNLVVLNGESSTAFISMEGGIGNPYSATNNTLQVIGFDNALTFGGQSSSQEGVPYGNVIVRIANNTLPTFSTTLQF